MTDSVLLLNAGSSSLKATLMDTAGVVVAHGMADRAGSATRYLDEGPDGQQRSGSDLERTTPLGVSCST